MSYRLAYRGVLDTVTGDLIMPHMAQWSEYEEWLRAGNVPLPMIVVVPEKTPGELAAEAEQAARKTMRNTLRAEPVVDYLRTHTPLECATWVTNNVTDLASARNVISKLAMIVAYLARERLQPEVDPPADPVK